MDETALHLPEWYDPSSAATIETGGYWVPPLAAGLDERGDTISLVVLHHRSFEPAYIRELPRDTGIEQVHGCFVEAARTVAEFNLLLCCAVEESTRTDTLCSTGPWLWVRYPQFVSLGGYDKNKYLNRAWDKNYYFALALATQLQEDLNTFQEFDHEFRHLLTLTGAMRRLKQILLSRLPEDMRRIACLHHDLSF